MDDVAGETAETEGETAGEIEEGACGEEDGAEDEEGAAEVAGGIHEESLAAGRLWLGAVVEESRFQASLGMTVFWYTRILCQDAQRKG